MGVDKLVIGDPVAERVDETDLARGPGRQQQLGDRRQVAVLIPDAILVGAAVDDVDAADGVIGEADGQPVAVELQIIGGDERDAEPGGETGVLVIGDVVGTVGDDDDLALPVVPVRRRPPRSVAASSS